MRDDEFKGTHYATHYASEEDWHNNQNVDMNKCTTRYVAEALNEEVVSTWRSGASIAISAGTGSGKNTFVESVILPRVKTYREKVLYLYNRTALGRQAIARFASIFNEEYRLENYSDFGLTHELREFKNLTVLSYQCLGDMYVENDKRLKEFEKIKFDWIVCDEVHYFCNDCEFNGLTDIELEYIENHFDSAIKIFMTATPDEIFPRLFPYKQQRFEFDGSAGYPQLPIAKMSNLLYGTSYPTFWVPGSPYDVSEEDRDKYFPLKWKLYEFERDYSYIEPCFGQWEECVDAMRLSDAKGIIFVNSKAQGEAIKSLLGEEAVFVTSDSKAGGGEDSRVYNEIVNTEKFSCKYLITTSVMDNGINIKDRKVTNVLIFTDYKCGFLQSLGRIRIEGDRKIKLFIPIVDKRTVSNLKAIEERKSKAYAAYDVNPRVFWNSYIAPRDSNVSVTGATTLVRNEKLHLNKLAVRKVSMHSIPYYTRIVNAFSDENPYPLVCEKFGWINQQFSLEYQIGEETRLKARERLKDFLTGKCEIPMDSQSQKEFRERFMEEYLKGYEKTTNFKKTEIWGLKKINDRMKSKNMGYIITSNRGTWVLSKEDMEQKSLNNEEV